MNTFFFGYLSPKLRRFVRVLLFFILTFGVIYILNLIQIQYNYDYQPISEFAPIMFGLIYIVTISIISYLVEPFIKQVK